MILIGDDPIVRSMEQSGYPPWMLPEEAYENDEQEEDEYGFI